MLTGSLLASALLVSLFGAPVMAQGSYTPGIDRTQQAISARIQQGMASGHITPSEARELYRRDRDIEMRETQMKSNGNVIPQERRQLRDELNGLRDDLERLLQGDRRG